jgi:hypothetical protein
MLCARLSGRGARLPYTCANADHPSEAVRSKRPSWYAETCPAAVAIALEALPDGETPLRVEVDNLSGQEGEHSWRVTVFFNGPFGRGVQG